MNYFKVLFLVLMVSSIGCGFMTDASKDLAGQLPPGSELPPELPPVSTVPKANSSPPGFAINGGTILNGSSTNMKLQSRVSFRGNSGTNEYTSSSYKVKLGSTAQQ